MKNKFLLSWALILLAFASPAASIRFFESSADTPLNSSEFWLDNGIYHKPVWRDNAYQLTDNRYYLFGNSEISRTGKENAEISVRVKMVGAEGSFAFAVGTQNNHDAGYRISLNGNEKGVLPHGYLVFVWDNSKRTGQLALEAPEEFRVPWDQSAEYTLKVDVKGLRAVLLVNGKIAVEKSMKSYLGGRMAIPDQKQNFYIHLNPSQGKALKASVEKLSVKLEGNDSKESMPPELINRASLLNNPNFKLDSEKRPYCWGYETPDESFLQFDPMGQDGVRIQGKGTVALSQSGIKLKKGEKYRVGAWIRTTNFKASNSALCIMNYQWQNDKKSKPFPVNTNGEWVRWEEDLICPNPSGPYSLNSVYYGFSIVAWGITEGILEAKNPYLIAMTPEAERFSCPAFDSSNPDNFNIIPVSPLHKVQQTNAKIRFYCTYDFKEMEPNCSITMHLLPKDKPFKSFSAPLKNNFAEINIPGPLDLGNCDIQVDFYQNGKRLKYQYYRLCVVKNDISQQGIKQNNCVTQLYSGDIPADGLKFHLNDWQWIYVSVPQAPTGTIIQIDNEKIKLYEDGFAPEAMRLLANGDHVIQIPTGVPGKITLREIPEILIYPFQVASTQNLDKDEYGVDYFRKYLWHACNVHNLGTYTTDYTQRLFQEVTDRGAKILQCAGLNGDEYFDTKKAIISGMWHGKSGDYGRTIDEISAGDCITLNTNMGDAFWIGQNRNTPTYVWTVHSAPFYHPSTQMNLLAGLSAIAGGRGKLLAEVYFTSYPTMDELEKRLLDEKEIVRKMNAAFPDLKRLRMEIGCTYIDSLGRYCSDCYPEADMKYVLDRYWHMVATDPVYDGIYGVGNYSMHHADEEIFRWIGALFRHYFIEGKTELLSSHYGYTLLPDHLKNGDFRDALTNWAVSGNVAYDTINGYGNLKQTRMLSRNHNDITIGDHVAVFKDGGKNGKITQKLTGLVPGENYILTYVTAYRADLSASPKQHTRHELVATIDDGAISPEYVATENPSGSSTRFFRHRIIFQAKKAEATLTIADARTDRSKGDLLLNAIALRPYFKN